MPFQPGQSGNPKGRPRKADVHRHAITEAEKRIADRLPEIVDSLIGLALGVKVIGTGLDGQPTIYTTPPDEKAAKYLVDRILGKPTERQEVEMSGVDGEPIVREIIIEVPNVSRHEHLETT